MSLVQAPSRSTRRYPSSAGILPNAASSALDVRLSAVLRHRRRTDSEDRRASVDKQRARDEKCQNYLAPDQSGIEHDRSGSGERNTRRHAAERAAVPAMSDS